MIDKAEPSDDTDIELNGFQFCSDSTESLQG